MSGGQGFIEVARGAEAVIEKGTWFGRPCIRKRRIPKGYRRSEIDRELRMQRTKCEARLMSEARDMGFPTPHILDVDVYDAAITMEFVEGRTAKDFMNVYPEEADDKAFEIGVYMGRLHKGGMVHGDLTTSNILMSPEGMRFIDMGLGSKTESVEDMGVDLHLVKEALESTHNHIPGLFDSLLGGYKSFFEGAAAVEKKLEDIESRGRYT